MKDADDIVDLCGSESSSLQDLIQQSPDSLGIIASSGSEGDELGEHGTQADSLIIGSSGFTLESFLDAPRLKSDDGSTIGPNSTQKAGHGSTVETGGSRISLDQADKGSNGLLRPDSPTRGEVVSSTPDLCASPSNEPTAS